MRLRKLGAKQVAAIGLGCMGITHAYGEPMSERDGVKTIQKALEIGYTFFDTAECYTGTYPNGKGANNEEIVGKALKAFRHEVVLSTKFGVRHEGKTLFTDSSPGAICKAVEGSLKRLQTDYIDLYFQHRIDPKIPPEEVAWTMAKLMREGKILSWGISETSEEYLRRAHEVCPVTAVQNRYSMAARWHEKLFPVLEELGVVFVAFSPIANGFLSGKYSADSAFDSAADYRSSMPQYTAEGFDNARELFDLLNDLAAKKQATAAQISLAWLLAKKPYIIPIPGTRKAERLAENFGAAEVLLSNSELEELESKLAVAEIPVFGGHKIESR